MAKKSKRRSDNGDVKNGKQLVYRQPRPTRNFRSTMGVSGPTNDARLTQALLNPFSPVARGAKIPDDDSARSIAFTSVNRKTVSVGGSTTVFTFTPNLSTYYKQSQTISGGVVTVWNPTVTPVENFTNISDTFSQYRIVSWGVRVVPLAAPTAQSGYISMQTNGIDATVANYDPYSGFYEEIENYPVAGSEVMWVAKPQGTDWKVYQPIAAGHNWTSLAVFIDGYTGLVLFETVFNVEATVQINTIAGALATPAEDHKPHVLTLTDHVRNRTKHAHPNEPAFSATLKSAMAQGIGMLADAAIPAAGKFLMRAFGVPSVPRLLTGIPEVD